MKQQLAAFNSIMSDCASDCDGGNVAEDDPIPAGLWQLWRDSAHTALLHDAEVIRAFVSAVKQGGSKDVEQGYMWDVNDVADFAEEYIEERVAKTEKEKVSHE
jgi:hypothetical protein